MDDVNRLYQRCTDITQEIAETKRKLEKLETQKDSALTKYRIESANRVLTHIRCEIGRTSECKDIDKLLFHCQNKLNGNIDGIELSLDEEDDL